ncbi:YbfB/YjiJ family MFS transporter [Thauera sp. 2A1]|uniref:YbfB/YjiJ family MFS transporter n=1 Tax=Thauera sp. 2A1 TaxID=2570191 RepID=UPI00129266C8|nr:YbfB/YjiJ family MFS transporter [Thauera sp. 2A1]KAI5916787.1 YbfB/YjiJ family MFS transporter [Thauera sp. 2A1]
MVARSESSLPPRSIVLIGLVALAIAMGIGRFAFTPLMPLMLRDGSLDAVTGTEWATANYIGYLLGALSASWFARSPRHGLQIGLIGVAATTLAMAWGNVSLPWLGLALRGSAGVFSAWVLVCASSWCLPELARRNATSLGGWIYTGVGLGIAATGLMTWLGGAQAAVSLWMELGLLAIVGAAHVIRSLPRQPAASAPSGPVDARRPAAPSAASGNLGVVLCYSAFGFGYIVPATFLPTMARQLVSDPLVFGLTWPIFGTAAALSVAFAAHRLHGWSRRKVWAIAQGVMAVGTALPLLQQALWVLAASAVLVGGTFMVTTMAGLQLARERMPGNPTPLLARMTTGFAAGQIAGPLLVRLIGDARIAGWDALGLASAAASLLLAITSIWLWRGGTASASRQPSA